MTRVIPAMERETVGAIPDTIEQFVPTRNGRVFLRIGGCGPALLLLHGFPETSLMWRDVAEQLLPHFTLIAADLPGYGASDCPPERDDHSTLAKRAMAATLVEAMEEAGFDQFAVAGHDRGGRVAYRMALDHPLRMTRVAVLDVIPTLEVWERADARLALSFWPFSLLAQSFPMPEKLIMASPAAVVDNALTQWGSPADAFSAGIREAYVAALSDAAHVHSICEEYRAAATIDPEHDRATRQAGLKIPALSWLYGAQAGGWRTGTKTRADPWGSGRAGPII